MGNVRLPVIVMVTFLLAVSNVQAKLYFEEETLLTRAQRNTLNQFRDRVLHHLPHDYMKQDLYLIRFLKSKDFRLGDAEKALHEALEWRVLNSMDYIDSEDFSDLEADFPLYFDAVDKEGRVVMESHFGAWPMRTAVLAGKLGRLKRYGVRAIETATRKVRDLQAQGKNVTQWVMLLNMEGFSVVESACPACLPYYLNFVNSYEKYYPFSVGDLVYVNTPSAFEIILSLVRPVMNAQTRKVMKIYGADASRWGPYVEKHFHLDQIATWFGGYKDRQRRGF